MAKSNPKILGIKITKSLNPNEILAELKGPLKGTLCSLLLASLVILDSSTPPAKSYEVPARTWRDRIRYREI